MLSTPFVSGLEDTDLSLNPAIAIGGDDELLEEGEEEDGGEDGNDRACGDRPPI